MNHFRGIFKDKVVSMLATGPSLQLLQRKNLPGLVIGLNQSDKYIQSDWHIYGHPVVGWKNKYSCRLFSFHSLNGSTKINMLTAPHRDRPIFSLDLNWGAYQMEAPALGLQVLAWLEPSEVRIYGLDLSGPRMSGTEIPQFIVDYNILHLRCAISVLKTARPNMRVLNCSPNKLDFMERG